MNKPYIDNPNRLADVIAAIQAMGTFKFYKLSFSGWAKRIVADETQEDYWKKVFEEHPEFFRLDTKRNKASLVWRRNYQRLYDVDKEEKITKEVFKKLTQEKRDRISRNPLDSSDILILVNTAINLHSREIDQKRDSRWWLAGAIGLAGVALGAMIKALA